MVRRGRLREAIDWVNEGAVLIILCITSVVLIIVYSSSSTVWLGQTWNPDINMTTRSPVYQPLLPHDALLGTSSPVLSVDWTLSLWNYCVIASGIEPTTSSCFPWKDMCTGHRSEICNQIASMQSLSFLSLMLSLMSLYSAHRAIAETSFLMTLWCMSCRAIQVAVETGLILLAFDLQTPSLPFPYGLTITVGVVVCGLHMCISTLAFVGAVFVFLRSHDARPATYILFDDDDNNDV
ncbi:Aste57867_22183 [Aphanomyces stellatus]|uniref:Aste57867_22183 protein n=1 Tax=Aphanomyces stellatus TaxID=120398 RepID=A0A485LKU7_9STRA|nr:hypothetical protein As57867_022114 [Aphanomyces stellatus]VFT98850.1 Aste57867_22183 [Aphanomyces stellatus]